MTLRDDALAVLGSWVAPDEAQETLRLRYVEHLGTHAGAAYRECRPDHLTVGALVAFNMLANQVNGPVLRLAQMWQDFQQVRISAERLGDILNNPAEPTHRLDKANPGRITGKIAFDHVTFRYRPDGPEVLADVSLEVPAGQMVGIVGPSGSGKSTLTKLVQRLYIPERGRVAVPNRWSPLTRGVPSGE